MPTFQSPRDPPRRLLLLDPHPLLRHGVQELLAKQAGLRVEGSFGCSGDLLQRLRQQEAAIDLLLVDALPIGDSGEDRKSTRLNSSHSQISYAVFCLKKKKQIIRQNAI